MRQQTVEHGHRDLSSLQLCACTRGNSVPRKQRRLNGFQYPLHPQQIIGWATLSFASLTTFLILVPGVGAPYHDPFLYSLLFLYITHSIFNLVTAVVDPAEEEVRKNKREIVPEFDRTKHTHVIENGRCHLCNITCTSQKTKHCSICNKCVKNFDHHCKWLNHCIGKRNYALFLSSVVSAIAIAFTTIALSAIEIIYYFIDPTKITFGDFVSCGNETVPIHVVTTKEVCFLTFATFLAVLAAVICILLMHLCSFHVYISYLGLTTYEYMRNQHDKNGVYMKDGRRCQCRRDEFPMVETGRECECFKHRNNALELASDDPQHFKEYVNGNVKKKSSLCHNQIDPLHDRQQDTRNKPLREIILSPLPLKSKYAPNVPNGEMKDSKKVLSPILEGNNEIVNVTA